jgi:hypothetical protein
VISFGGASRAFSERMEVSSTIYQKKAGMQLKTTLNHVQKFKSFVYTIAFTYGYFF